MNFVHETVLLKEAVDGLNVRPDGIYVDCTLGGGGHSGYLASKLSDHGRLIAFDQDITALQSAKERLSVHRNKITFIKSNFRFIKRELEAIGVEKVDGVLYDLGVSSPQLDTPERGFSYHHDAPLDMRMDLDGERTAYEIVNEWAYEDLVRIFFRYGEEKFSKQIARKIEEARKKSPIETTGQLVDIIKEAIPAPARRKGGHPAKRVFQAIRIAVNDELSAFEQSLSDAIELLNTGGRVSVITFHSLEDRICKQLFKSLSSGPDLPPGLPILPDDYQPELKIITKKPIIPNETEIMNNHRARSAKLRIAEKI